MTPPETDQSTALRLRSARLAQGLDLAGLGRELKLPQTTLEAMERGDWARLGAPVFARHLLQRYARRLDVDIDCESIAGQLPDPPLSSRLPRSQWGRFAEFSARQVTYVTGSLLLLPALYLLLVQWPDAGSSAAYALDPPVAMPALPVAVPTAPAPALVAAPDATAPVQIVERPPTTSLASTAASTVAAGLTPSLPLAEAMARRIEMRFTADSWIEVLGRDGSVLERALARSGEARQWPVEQVGRVTIGNALGTEVRVDGSGVNLDAVRTANVARFALSSEGAIETVPR